jgi:hypothetical protein
LYDFFISQYQFLSPLFVWFSLSLSLSHSYSTKLIVY